MVGIDNWKMGMVVNPSLCDSRQEYRLMLGRVAPFWIPDDEADECMTCNARFNVVRRRHHCRACGKVVCGGCSSVRFPLVFLDGKEARVCHICHGVMTQLDLGQQDKTFGESLSYIKDLFEYKNPSPEEIFETLRSLLEAKSKREQFLEGLIEILSQVWEILTVRRFDGGRDFFKPYFRGGFVGIGKTVSHGKCGSESSSCIGDEEDDDYIESGIDATSDEMLGYSQVTNSEDTELSNGSSNVSLDSPCESTDSSYASTKHWVENCSASGDFGKGSLEDNCWNMTDSNESYLGKAESSTSSDISSSSESTEERSQQATYVSTVTMSVMQDEKGGSTFVNITYDDLVVEKPTARFANKKRQRVGGKRIKKRVSFIDWRRTEDTHNNSLQNCVSSGSLIENQANHFQSMPRIDEY